MKKLITLMLILSTCMFAGNHEKLIGTWKADIEALKKNPEFEKANKDPNQKMMVNMMLNMFGKMKMTFTKDKLEMQIPSPDGNTKTEKGTYKILVDKNKTIELNAVSEKGDKEIMLITFVDDKNILMGPKNEKGMMGKIPFTKE